MDDFMTIDAIPSHSAPGCLDKSFTIAQIDRLKELPLDWNGYGAQPIDVELIEQAKSFIKRLPDNIIDAPAVVPMTRGRLQFEWHRGNRSLELEFESTGRLHYLKADDDSGIEEEDILLTNQAAPKSKSCSAGSRRSDRMTARNEPGTSRPCSSAGTASSSLVPTLRVGMPSWTLCVPLLWQARTTRSVADCIPTGTVGTSVVACYR